MDQPEPTPEPDDDEEDSSQFAALLREVARPESVRLAQLPNAAQELQGALQHVVARTHEPREGELVDEHYRIQRTLGRGGMGVVFAAQNVRTGKQVALKWLSGLERADTQRAHTMAARFRREARAAASIRHPNVVDVYDVGGDDASPYLVMELLEGESLRELNKRRALSWDEACAIMLPVLRGVEAAHNAGIIHRDLKPDNIFLCKSAENQPLPKVLDFGVASMRDSSSDGIGTLTHTGSVLGTPSYMPLEQLKGESVDVRADIYALGVLLYELLTQSLPFNARGASELAVKQATEAPTPLSKHNKTLRGAREAAVMRALARRPSDRYASASAFADALQKAERSRPSVHYWVVGALLVAGFALWLSSARTPTQSSLPRPSLSAPVNSEVGREPNLPTLSPEPPAVRAPSPTEAAARVPTQPAQARPAARKRPIATTPARPTPTKLKEPTSLSVDDF